MAPQPPDGEAERSTGSTEESPAAGDSPARSPLADDHWDAGFPENDLGEVGTILRDRLHQAVSGLEPGPGTLDYLRRAVPARRRRRHAALAATAVSVFAVSAGATLAARGSFGPGHPDAGGSNVGTLLTTSTNGAPGGGSSHGPATPGGQDMTSGGSAATEAPSSAVSVSGSTKSTQVPSVTSPTATGTPLAGACQSSSMTSVTATQGAVTGGVTYETFVGTVKSACSVAGMPSLTVLGAGGVSAKVPVFRADQRAAPLLPSVPAGQTLVLQPGERFEFQLAWVPLTCPTNPPPTTPPTSVPSTTDGPTAPPSSSAPTPTGASSSPSGQPTPSGTPSSSASSSKTYSVTYTVGGSQAVQSASFTADCGASVYVTDYFPAPGSRHAGQPPSTSESTQ
jgi:hypothetical protein